MPGSQTGSILFASLIGKKEAGFGTAPSFASGGRKFLVEPTGLITLGKTWELGEERSIAYRAPIIATTATLVSNEPELSVSVPAASIDEASIWFGAAFEPTISGTAAPYTWTIDPSNGTASQNPTSYSFISQDALGGTTNGGNAYLITGALPTELSISAERSGLTSMSATLFAQNVAETTTNPAASTAIPTSVFMPGRLWKVAIGTALATGTFTDFGYALDMSLTLQTGIAKWSALNGTATISGYAETARLGGELTLTVQSNAAASSDFYQALGSQKFIRLTWTDATYSLTIYLSTVIADATPISGEDEGITTMAISARVATDPVSLKPFKIVAVNSVSALP
jgi:hypothetical protein